ncbi:MAG: hypothetical protein IME96_05335 [Proteobacteria bacterium]|nr:hypothetical protein [Pseudomonadota bacterium]
MYYKVLMEGGHVGAGKSYDMTRYFKADNIGSIYDLLHKMPRLKSKGLGKSVKLIQPVSEEEFIKGRHCEKRDPYLMRH